MLHYRSLTPRYPTSGPKEYDIVAYSTTIYSKQVVQIEQVRSDPYLEVTLYSLPGKVLHRTRNLKEAIPSHVKANVFLRRSVLSIEGFGEVCFNKVHTTQTLIILHTLSP